MRCQLSTKQLQFIYTTLTHLHDHRNLVRNWRSLLMFLKPLWNWNSNRRVFLGYKLESTFFSQFCLDVNRFAMKWSSEYHPRDVFFPLSSLLAFIILLVNTGFAVVMCIDVRMCFFVDMLLFWRCFFPRIFLVAKLDQDTQNTQHV